MRIHLGDLPTWVAAVGTVGTLGAALTQIGAERKRRLKSEHEAHARLISAVLGPSGGIGSQARMGVDLTNGSAEPVYSLVVGLALMQGAATRNLEEQLAMPNTRQSQHDIRHAPITTASVLSAGTYRVWIPGGWLDSPETRLGAEVAFTDRNGSHWIRRANGQLEELRVSPLEYFEKRGLYRPFELVTPERIP